jgi:Na+/melibiose symporter-like transporter
MTESVDDPSAPVPPAAAPAAAQPPRLNSLKWFYGLGSVAFAVKNGGAGFLLLFYNQVLGLSPAVVGLAILATALLDAFIDPAIGYFSDNFRSRLGRRHPFMYAALLPGVIAFAMLLNPPHLDHAALGLYLFVVYAAVRVLFSCFEIPNNALLPELTHDYDERTSFVSLRTFLGGIGGTTMLFVTYQVFLVPTPQQPAGLLNGHGYNTYGIVAAILVFIIALISAIGTHRAIPYLRQPPPKARPNLFRALRVILTTLTDRSVVVLLICGVIWAVAAGVTGSLTNYLNIYFWELTAKQISWFQVATFLSFVLAVVIAPWASRKIGKKATAIAGAIVWFVFGPAPIALRFLGFFPENGSPWLLPMLIFFMSIHLSIGVVSSMLVGSMMADVVESAEIKTGRRSEGLLSAASAFIAKSSGGFGVSVAGFLLVFVHFPQKAQPHHVAQGALDSLAIVYAVVLFGFYGVAAIILSAYTITRARHSANLDQLAARRSA